MSETKTLAEWLAVPASAELDTEIERAVFGDDLRARDLEAVEIVKSRFYTYKVGGDFHICDKEKIHGFVCGKLPILSAQDLWKTRESKPYAAALEAAVAAYRRPARPFSQDTPEGWWAMRELIGALKRFRQNWENDFHLVTQDTAYVDDAQTAAFVPGWVLENSDDYTIEYQKGDTLPLSVSRAALAAVWNEGDK